MSCGQKGKKIELLLRHHWLGFEPNTNTNQGEFNAHRVLWPIRQEAISEVVCGRGRRGTWRSANAPLSGAAADTPRGEIITTTYRTPHSDCCIQHFPTRPPESTTTSNTATGPSSAAVNCSTAGTTGAGDSTSVDDVLQSQGAHISNAPDGGNLRGHLVIHNKLCQDKVVFLSFSVEHSGEEHGIRADKASSIWRNPDCFVSYVNPGDDTVWNPQAIRKRVQKLTASNSRIINADDIVTVWE